MSSFKRRFSRPVQVGTVTIGGDAPVSIQSMTNTKTEQIQSTLEQIHRLVEAGCELVRVAVPHEAAGHALREIVRECPVPVIADIHFDVRLAYLALEQGAAKIRINPGNIGGKDKLMDLARRAAAKGAALRVGVNAGSMEKNLLKKYGGAVPQALVESALGYLQALERIGFENVVVSLKAADVTTMIEAYRLIADKVAYPLHLGVTEAGTLEAGTIKAAVGIGTLLAEGIGDTLRVSLTADPVEEIRIGRAILQALHLRQFGPELISCPTCGRCEVDLLPLAEAVTKMLQGSTRPIRVAVMGCAVNGPGEAREADFGVSAGRKHAAIFRKGIVVKTVSPDQILEALREELEMC
ncbi:MAG: flavodoxin-dependent (E)-4-hydroxy-3-methylbut-2-enyl-diphosphate synthase [Bacillota bacterium]